MRIESKWLISVGWLTWQNACWLTQPAKYIETMYEVYGLIQTVDFCRRISLAKCTEIIRIDGRLSPMDRKRTHKEPHGCTNRRMKWPAGRLDRTMDERGKTLKRFMQPTKQHTQKHIKKHGTMYSEWKRSLPGKNMFWDAGKLAQKKQKRNLPNQPSIVATALSLNTYVVR